MNQNPPNPAHKIYVRILIDPYRTPTQTKRNRVMCHEVGHVLGVDHYEGGAGGNPAPRLNTSDSCMYPGSLGGTSDKPNYHDHVALEYLYGTCTTNTGQVCKAHIDAWDDWQ